MSTKLNINQVQLFTKIPVFPSTRFQGSKVKILNWIWGNIRNLEFKTALDAFGGTGCIGYLLKQKNKLVTYNDLLKFNWYIGLALIENDSVTLNDEDVNFLVSSHYDVEYPTFIYENFKCIYFTDEENKWIDMVVTNIDFLDNIYKKAMAYFALIQACIIKRPFNLFHRKNLYLRFSNVPRNFGNKTTWDTPFEIHFRNFVEEANRAVFSNGQKNKVLNYNIFEVNGDFDLVYIDTPYISKKGVAVDYLGFYHFLEGLVNYTKWEEMIDYKTKHRRLKTQFSPWLDKKSIYDAFDKLFRKFSESILVISYRSDGIPAINDLKNLLKKYKSDVVLARRPYKYVLSNNHSEEVLLIGK